MATRTADSKITSAERYRTAVQAFSRAPGPAGPNDALLASLYRLNAVYYLDAYLPEALFERAVRQAAMALEREIATPRAAHEDAHCSIRPHGTVRGLLTTLNCRGAGTVEIVAAQHALEIVPVLDPAGAEAVVAGVQRRLASAPTDRRALAALGQATRNGIAEWAAVNGRPPRDGETAGWAECLAKRPEAALQRALASGLRFSALLDALTLAASHRSTADAGAHPLIAAHAVRRLTELGGKPAIGPWLAVAMKLGATRARDRVDEPADASELAGAAVQSGEGALVQLAEAALMEREALPPELGNAPLQALRVALAAARSEAANNEQRLLVGDRT